MLYWPISFRVAILLPAQSSDRPSAREVTLKDMDTIARHLTTTACEPCAQSMGHTLDHKHHYKITINQLHRITTIVKWHKLTKRILNRWHSMIFKFRSQHTAFSTSLPHSYFIWYCDLSWFGQDVKYQNSRPTNWYQGPVQYEYVVLPV